MHYGEKNPKREYSIRNINSNRLTIEKSASERDLGLIVTENYDWAKQTQTAVNKANKILGCLKNSFTYYTSNIAKIVYPVFVRPHLEFASSVWNPHQKKLICMLENVQRRATKTSDNWKMTYEERLNKMGLTNISIRRKRSNLIQCYKLLNGIDKVNWNNNIIQINETNNRRNKFRLIRENIKNCTSRYNFLLNRIATTWNNLPKDIVESEIVNIFQKQNRHLFK
jgi:hypothetical protein